MRLDFFYLSSNAHMPASSTSSLEEAFHIALQKHKAGDLLDAGAIYEKLLEYLPDNIDILYNYSVLLLNQGISTKPQKLLARALQIAPEMRELYILKISALRLSRKYDLAQESLDYFEKKFNPDIDSDAQRLLILHDRRIEDIASHSRELYLNRNFTEAEEILQKAIEEHSDSSLLLQPIGELYLNWGKPLKAIEALEIACKKDKYNFNAWNQKGIVLMQLRKYHEAHAAFIEALKMLPNDAALLTNIGFNLLQGNFFEKSQEFLKKALEIEPHRFSTRRELASTHIKLKEWEKALNIIKKLKKESPNDHMLLELEANFYTSQGLIDEGIPILKKALKLNPNSLNALSSLIFSLNYTSQKIHLKDIEIIINKYQSLMKEIHKEVDMRSYKKDNNKIRVGFVSGDFGNHPVGFFIANVIPHFDQDKITCIGIPTIERSEPFAQRIKKMFQEWLDISHLSDEDAQTAIKANKIDILIDLSGHTAYNRLGLFSRRAAPTQITWLGYFATTGIESMDYILIDRPSLHEKSQSQFTEKIIELPGARLCFSTPDDAPDITPTPALKNGFITFGNYQNYSKVTDEVIEIWIKILKAIPKSRLRIQNSQFADKKLQKTFIYKFNAAGIPTSRLELHGPTPRHLYLQSHAEVDLILDTFPFPGGTTTCEALWMGVPTISLVGNTLIQRQGYSILSSANLESWCVTDKEKYIEKAIISAKNIGLLNTIRLSMRDHVSKTSLFDGKKLANHLSSIFENLFAAQNEKNGHILLK